MRAGVVRRALLTAMALVAVAVPGCSGDDPVESHEPLISDTATFVGAREYADGFVKEYELDGVRFFGDIRVSDYEFALSVAEPRFAEGEVLLSVLNSRVWPRSATRAPYTPADGFTVETCTADSVASCNEGRFYVFRPTRDGYGLDMVWWWHRD